MTWVLRQEALVDDTESAGPAICIDGVWFGSDPDLIAGLNSNRYSNGDPWAYNEFLD